MAQVSLNNICKNFGNAKNSVSVLNHINLTVADGEFLVLVGPSGCGKSTLLRLIAGLESPTSGSILINDRCVNDRPPKARDIAMVFQSYALYPHLTVYENLAFGLRRLTAGLSTRSPWHPGLDHLFMNSSKILPKKFQYRSSREAEINDRVQRVAHLLQIETLLKRLPKQLSGGQKQRVALGRAIARNPQVFLMDEPLSNLDAQLRGETRAQIVTLQQQLGVTTLYVTHDQIEAMTMGQRIAVLNQGNLQQIDTPLNLYNYPCNRFVAEFIGSPPMNFLPVVFKPPNTIVHPSFRFSLAEQWSITLLETAQKLYPSSLDSVQFWLGIRPEHLTLGQPAVKNIPATVKRVEALGSVTDLSVQLESQTQESTVDPGSTVAESSLWQVRIPSDQTIKIGDRIHLALRPDRIHLFDLETGGIVLSSQQF